MILHEKTKEEFGYEFATASNRSLFYCLCDYCGKEFSRPKRTIVQCNEVIKKDSCGVGQCKRQKSEDVNKLKHGVANAGGSESSLQKRKQTSLEKYGNEHYARTEEFKSKNNQQYGVDYYSQTEAFLNKRKETCRKRYGVDHYAKNKEFREKFRAIFLEKYGVPHYSMTDEFKIKLKNTCLDRYGAETYFKSQEFADRFSGSTNHYGKAQLEVRDFLNSFGFDFKPDRKILAGKEIDLVCDKLAVEYCGLFWHNEFSLQPRTRSYHYNKYKKCLEQGIRLVTIFEDEWLLKKQQCQGILKAILGKPDKKIFARKTKIEIVESSVFKKFCDDNHLLGKPHKINVAYGLVYENELVAAVSLGRHPRDKDDLVLNRLCFKNGIQVVGGASKLIAACKKWASSKPIVSWSDNRWSSGGVYATTGFTLDAELPPDYSYVWYKGGSLERLTKQSCKKSCKACPPEKTEREWMAELGYARIWDCGKKRWILTT